MRLAHWTDKALYKAARSSSTIEISAEQVGYDVSPSHLQHTCKLFAIYHFDPKAISCKFCFSERQLQLRPALHRPKVKLTGFSSKGLSKLMHVLDGNIHFVQWNIPTPTPRSSQWKLNFTAPVALWWYLLTHFMATKISGLDITEDDLHQK